MQVPNRGIADLTALLQQPTVVTDAKTRRAGYWGSTVHLEAHDAAKGVTYTGSGLLLSAGGYLITNYHVTDHGLQDITVRLHGDLTGADTYTLKLDRLLCKHETYDLMLARCHIPPALERRLRDSLPPIALADQIPALGAEVRVYGHAREVVEERVGRVLGAANMLRRSGAGGLVFPTEDAHILRGKNDVAWFTDAPIEHGFSGGPVVDATSGELLGLTWAMFGSRGSKDHSYICADGIRTVLRAYLQVTQESNTAPSQPSGFERVVASCAKRARRWLGSLQSLLPQD